jgi:hypothetical protein
MQVMFATVWATLGQVVLAIAAPEAPHTMALAARRIQDQAVLAMPVLVGPATQVRVERVKTVRRFADKVRGDLRWPRTLRSPLCPAASADGGFLPPLLRTVRWSYRKQRPAI